MPRVLIIEDEPKLRRSLQRGLQEAGFHVATAGSTAEGSRHLGDEPPDAVILDLMLPDGSGLDLLRSLRHDGCATPVLVVTARDAVTDRVLGLDSGADDYLVKPFAFNELLARMRALLRRTSESNRIDVEGLELDLLARRVVRGGKEIELTNRQFDLLAYLVRHAGQAVSREMLVRDVWRDETGVLTNVVDVSINHLRRRVERDGLPPLIHTIRGVGYMLKDHTWSG
ncbi:MAG: response regulator transcription factor [Planctomycetaceae bacterium]|nr:response regulator transcription factor [Planctomycetaceae bacterium]